MAPITPKTMAGTERTGNVLKHQPRTVSAVADTTILDLQGKRMSVDG